jgi:cytochrome c553
MRLRLQLFLFTSVIVSAVLAMPGPIRAQTSAPAQAPAAQDVSQDFRTADRCFSCHNNVTTAEGEDVSIGFQWRASIMANAARDPYWQGSVRRETIDHPESSAIIQNDCASCHAPAQNQQDKMLGQETELFKHLDFTPGDHDNAATADGVTCSVCHQIQATGLNTPATYNGNFSVAPHGTQPRPIFGPFVVDPTLVTPMHIGAVGYAPVQSDHIREAGLCGSCHTLYTNSLGPGGKQLAKFPEQMPYIEWQHSDYRDKQTCQECHMPVVKEPVAVAQLLADPRDGVHRHTFTGANFLMQDMLNAHRQELGVAARPDELTDASARTTTFLQSQAARVTVGTPKLSGSELDFAVRVENLTGHKLPTAYPSRRAWLHVVVTAADGHIVFESGKLNPDGSIAGNANDADPTRFTPHFTRISRPDQVQIFEPILGDSVGHVTTGLLNATQYLKDNRILPAGFDKDTASPDIAVHGEAAADPDFTAGSATTHYAIDTGAATGSFRVAAELIYQPVGFRWAHNLAPYKADEPQRFVNYYDQAAAQSAVVLARAETTIADH